MVCPASTAARAQPWFARFLQQLVLSGGREVFAIQGSSVVFVLFESQVQTRTNRQVTISYPEFLGNDTEDN